MSEPSRSAGRPEPDQVPGRPVVVIGMDRSGTSLAASLVDAWGAFGGEEGSLTAGNRGNPHGYFEHRPMQRFLLHELGADFWRPGYVESLREKAKDPALRREAFALMAGMRQGGEIWYWKEPLLSVTLPFWHALWGKSAAYVVLLRDPWKCGRSWQRLSLPQAARERVSLDAAALLRWQVFMLSILEETGDGAARLFLRYETLVRAPEGEVGRLARFLDVWKGGEPSSPEILAAMTSRIDPALDRTESSVGFLERDEAGEGQKLLWKALTEMVEEPGTSIDVDAMRPWPGWREYLANLREFWLLYERSAPLLRSRWAVWAARAHHGAGALVRRLTGPLRQARVADEI